MLDVASNKSTAATRARRLQHRLRSWWQRGITSAVIALLLSACGEPDGAIATQSTSTNELVVTVTEITTDFGNINTDLERLKAADAGLVPGAQFRLSFGARMVYGLFATTYEDVAEGEWVAILTEDDNVQFARSFDNAATALKVQVGSKLRVRASGTQ